MKPINRYRFMLTLKDVKQSSKMLDDKLKEADCEDAIVTIKDNRCTLFFNRVGESYNELLNSAIRDLESTALKVDTGAPESKG
jgi:rRNA maturation protein Rpf1